MKAEILNSIDQPNQLEKLYRKDKIAFKRAFNELYPEINGNTLATYWNERLNFTNDEITWGSRNELLFIIVAALIAGIIAKFPVIFHINENFFYPRNIGFIVFPALTAYFAWKNKIQTVKWVGMAAVMLVGLLFINWLPDVPTSDTLILSCIHLPLLLWAVLGVSFVGGIENDEDKRLRFLKYNGDLVVMTTLMLIAGGILSAITIGLFSLIGFKIEDFYMENVGVFGIAAAPVVATYLTQTNPQLVGKVSPVIAKIFSPLVLVMLVVYVGAMMYSGKDPYSNREFLLIFNALLVGVMALIFFSIAGNAEKNKSKAETGILLALSVVTIVVNGIALSAIIFRISEWGITPNRAAILGGNILILINLTVVAVQLYRYLVKKTDLMSVGRTIAWYLPVYCIWTIIVTFLFPIIFGYR